MYFLIWKGEMGWWIGEESSGRAVKEKTKKNILRIVGRWRTESRIVCAKHQGRGIQASNTFYNQVATHSSTDYAQYCLITLLDKSQSDKKNMKQMKKMKDVNSKKRRLSLENTLTGCICQGRSPLPLQGRDNLLSCFHCNLLYPEVRCSTFLSKF
jgi:hypothetical protein